ncbi:MAG: peptidase M48 [Chthoniobacterales bacterium]|nr:MAG: peptidase M48 [Chthoniobacterales bacterium]
MTRYLIFALAVIFSPVLAHGEQSSHLPAPVATPAGIQDAETATRAWLATISPEEKGKSNAYFEGGYWLILWNYLFNAAIAILLLSTRLSARLRDLAAKLTNRAGWQAALYALPFALITWTLSLPLNWYQNFFREHQYGMSNQTFASWFGDELKGLIIALIFLPIAFAVLYTVFTGTRRTWWIWGAIASILLFAVVDLVAPVFIEPLFNKYTPLSDPAIRDPILTLALANEIPVKQVFVVDQSRQTKRVSANVSGLAGTTRIALNDNLLNQCTLPEIREVMAHEMGHYVLNHGGKIILGLAILSLVGFGIAGVAFDALLRRYGTKWRVNGIADPAGVPLLLLIFGSYAFLITPISNTLSRTIEREADAFGINASREPDGTAQVALKLGKYRKMEPTPLEEFLFFDHPSGRARIRMAMDWKYAMLNAANGHP